MGRVKLIKLLTIILLVSILISHFFPPTGVLAIPFTMSLMTGLIFFTNNEFKIIIKSFLSYLYIGLNDIGIKLFAGGIHDSEGTGWLHLLLFIGLIPCLIMLIISMFKDESSNVWIKLLSILLFTILIIIHLYLFESLGMVNNINSPSVV